MTGIEVFRYLQQKVGHSYTGYMQPRANGILRNALYESVEDKYKALTTTKNYDEIRNYIITNLIAIPTNNFINTFSGTLSNYMHLLSVKARYVQPVYNVTIISSTATTPGLIRLNTRNNNFRSGEFVNIQTIGDVYLRKLNSVDFALYSDENLQTPVTGQLNLTGNLSRIFYKYCKQYTSQAKISSFVPSADSPYYEFASGGLKFYPLNIPCSEITIDYTKKLDDIIITSTQDYELLYPYKFLQYVIDKASVIFSGMVRDSELTQMSEISLKENP